MRCSGSSPAFPWGRLFSYGYCCLRRTGRSYQRSRNTFTTIFWPWERKQGTSEDDRPRERLSRRMRNRRQPSRSIRNQCRTFKLSLLFSSSFFYRDSRILYERRVRVASEKMIEVSDIQITQLASILTR